MDLYCALTIEACLKLNMHFDCRYLELRNACILRLSYIVLNVRDGMEYNYPSVVFSEYISYNNCLGNIQNTKSEIDSEVVPI